MKSLLTQSVVFSEEVGAPARGPGAKHIFTTLDALRGVAAICVVERHIGRHLFFPVLSSSYLAVDFFFALSGFVLTHAYARRFRDGQGFSTFMTQRAIRLYPLYGLGLVLGLMATLPGLRHLAPGVNLSAAMVAYAIAFALNIFMLPTTADIVTGKFWIFPFNLPSWSLMLEMAINVVFKMFYARVSTAILLGSIALAGILFVVCAAAAGTADIGWTIMNFGGGFARVAFSFPLGILVYHMWQKVKPPLSIHPLAYAAFLIAVLGIAPPDSLRAIYDALVIAIVFPLIILGAAESTTNNRRLQKISLTLGQISYATYILHYPMFLLLDHILQPLKHLHGAAHSTAIVTAAYTLAIPLACIAIDKFYDTPVRAFLTAKFLPKTPRSGDRAGATQTVKGS